MLWSVIDALRFVVLFFVIQAIFRTNSSIGENTLQTTLQYFLIIVIIETVTSTHFEEMLGEWVRNGKIDLQLAKPLSLNVLWGWTGIMRKLLVTIFKLPILILLFLFVAVQFQTRVPVPPTSQIAPLVAIFTMILLFQTCWSLILGWMTFWFDNGSSLMHLRWAMVAIFSGAMLPPTLMPTGLQQIITILPFKYLAMIPTQMWLNQYVMQAADWIYFGGFILASILLVSLSWNRGILRYTSAGG